LRPESGNDPGEKKSCILSGGEWIRPETPEGAPRYNYKCVHTFSDANKKCFSNDDCQGNCLITEDTVVEQPDFLKSIKSKVIGGFGACEKDDRRHPSYPGDFENPQGWVI